MSEASIKIVHDKDTGGVQFILSGSGYAREIADYVMDLAYGDQPLNCESIEEHEVQ